jgi:Putative peptidoglycan binding domain
MKRHSFLILLAGLPLSVHAHGGRTNAQGCHNQTGGSYHCHNGETSAPAPRYVAPRYESPPPAREPEPAPRSLSLLTRPDTGTYDVALEIAQKMLSKLGYTISQIDGIMGEETRTAISAFQSNQGLETTGTISSQLIDRLIDALAK